MNCHIIARGEILCEQIKFGYYLIKYGCFISNLVFGLEELYEYFFFCETRDPQRSEFFNNILMTIKDIKLLKY